MTKLKATPKSYAEASEYLAGRGLSKAWQQYLA